MELNVRSTAQFHNIIMIVVTVASILCVMMAESKRILRRMCDDLS